MAEFIHTINVSAAETGHAAVKITVGIQGTPQAVASTITRTGRCVAELGRAITRISKKYDVKTRSTR